MSYLQAYGYNFQALAMAVMIFNNYDELNAAVERILRCTEQQQTVWPL